MFLSERERDILDVLCDTFVPALEGADALSQFHLPGLAARVEQVLSEVLDEPNQREVKLLLSAWDYSVFNGATAGNWKSLRRMNQAEREDLLADWALSAVFIKRKAFAGLKRMILFLAYSNPPDGLPHPMWASLMYPGKPTHTSDEAYALTPITVRDNRTLSADVIVIGSGAGGGVVAAELAAAGLDVIIIEKGGYQAERDFDGDEFTANEKLFEKRGALTSVDTSVLIFAGATLGGGTTINWSASFRTPDTVLREWANTYGFTDATSPEYQRSLDAVSQRVNVNTAESWPNANNQVFAQGCERLGYGVGVIPRNVKGCEECGFCNFGCPFGAKQGTMKTYLQDAHACGARILVKADVRRVMHENGAVTGAIVEARDEQGRVHTLTIRARAVVACGGSLHTPALLLRSGLTNPHIGANLHLHPTTVVFSLFDEPIKTWEGVPMSRVCRDFGDLDGKGYGVTLEVAPAHPGLTAASLPWLNARSHRHLVRSIPYLANVLAITRDTYGGRVTLNTHGQPLIHYTLNAYDQAHVQRGVLEALKIHRAAGAREIFSPHNALLRYERQPNDDSQFVRYLRRVEDAGLAPSDYSLFSAHQMSSCRISATPRQGAIKPSGETYEVKNLFVADGSALPTATGVNPMISIMGLSHYLAQQIKAQLRA